MGVDPTLRDVWLICLMFKLTTLGRANKGRLRSRTTSLVRMG